MKPRVADFPDWLGPMLVKELRQGLRTRGFVFSFIGLQFALMFLMVVAVLLYARDPQDFDATILGAVFWILIGGLLIFVTPLRAFNGLAAERKANTLELIFLSGLTAWRIAFGKWITLFSQALLFVLAVLPFAILRYFFGKVDLVEDLQLLLIAVLVCAVATAVTLAISGLPLWVRGLVVVGAVALLVSSAEEMYSFVRSFLSGRSAPAAPAYAVPTYAVPGTAVPASPSPETGWWLVGVDCLLGTLLALEVAAASVAPPAENHAGRQRFYALLFWLPLPFLSLLGASEDVQRRQLGLSVWCTALFICHHLSVRPALFQNHCRAFRGWRSICGLPFQVGWPSATVFLVLVAVLLTLAAPSLYGIADAMAVVYMACAALLSSVFFWIEFRPRARFPLVAQTLFTALSVVLGVFLVARLPELQGARWFAFLPGMGFGVMMMMDDSPYLWLIHATCALGLFASLLLLRSRKYWVEYSNFCWGLAKPSTKL